MQNSPPGAGEGNPGPVSAGFGSQGMLLGLGSDPSSQGEIPFPIPGDDPVPHPRLDPSPIPEWIPARDPSWEAGGRICVSECELDPSVVFPEGFSAVGSVVYCCHCCHCRRFPQSPVVLGTGMAQAVPGLGGLQEMPGGCQDSIWEQLPCPLRGQEGAGGVLYPLCSASFFILFLISSLRVLQLGSAPSNWCFELVSPGPGCPCCHSQSWSFQGNRNVPRVPWGRLGCPWGTGMML